ncbi:MAG: hypothetical protein SPK23_06855 [Eubacteriales bacterium]|nr:hypothetical protein [Clostridiales bacterium]MDY5836818.1 hypothetical protein [Eubacteriales bacterium]
MLHHTKKNCIAFLLAIALLISNLGILGLNSYAETEESAPGQDPPATSQEAEAGKGTESASGETDQKPADSKQDETEPKEDSSSGSSSHVPDTPQTGKDASSTPVTKDAEKPQEPDTEPKTPDQKPAKVDEATGEHEDVSTTSSEGKEATENNKNSSGSQTETADTTSTSKKHNKETNEDTSDGESEDETEVGNSAENNEEQKTEKEEETLEVAEEQAQVAMQGAPAAPSTPGADKNAMPEDLVLIHLEKDGQEDQLRTQEGNEQEGVPVFKDKDGSYYYAKNADGNNPYCELTEFPDETYTYADDEGQEVTVTYKHYVNSLTKCPVYQAVKTIVKKDGDVVKEKGPLPPVEWTFDKTTLSYSFKPEGQKAPTHELSKVNRLEDKDDQGNVKSEYYVGPETPLNFELQFTPGKEVKKASLTIRLKNEKGEPLNLSQVEISKLKYANKDYDIQVNDDGSFTVSFPGGDYGNGSLSIKLPKLQGRSGDKLTMSIEADQDGNKEEIKRTFTITESAFGDPGVKIAGQTYTDKPLVVDGGPDQADGTIADSQAQKVAAELIYQAEGKWDKDPILRADVLKGKEVNSMTVLVDLPQDKEAGVYAEYLRQKGIKFEEIRNDQGQVTQLRLQLEKKDFDASDLKLETTTDADDNTTTSLVLNGVALGNATLTDYILTQKDDQGNETSVYVTDNGSFKLTKDFYQKIGESGYKFRGKDLLNDKNEVVATLGQDGSLTKDGKKYNLEKVDDKLTLKEVAGNEAHLKFLREGDQLYTYTDKLLLGLGNMVNEYVKDEKTGEFKTNDQGKKIAKANPFLEFVAGQADKLVNIVVTKTEDDVEKNYYGGTILLKDQAAEVDTEYKVVDQYGKAMNFTAKLVKSAEDASKTFWKFFRKDDTEGKYTKSADGSDQGDGITLSTTTDNLILDTLHEIKERQADKKNFENYQAIAPDQVKPGDKGRYAYDKENDIFIDANNANAENVRGFDYYEGLKEIDALKKSEQWIVDYTQKYNPDSTADNKFELAAAESGQERQTVLTREKDGDNITASGSFIEKGKQELFGSLDSKNYYMMDGKIYELSRQGENLILTNVDGKAEGSPFIANHRTSQTVRIYRDGRVENLGQADIYKLFQDARKFGLKFAGFHTSTPEERKDYLDGKTTDPKNLYDLKAIYTLEDPDNPGKTKDTLVESKFWLSKTSTEEPKPGFSKSAPDGLTSQMDNEVFNLLYRASDDRYRDKILDRLFDPDIKDLTPAEQVFRDRIASEYKRIYGEDFVWNVGDKADNSQLVRNLQWTLKLNSPTLQALPSDLTSYLIFEDSQLDNRLVYESLTFNLSRKAYLDAEKAAKDKNPNEEFKGNANLTFLEDVAEILFGVDTHAKDHSAPLFSRVRGWGLSLDKDSGLLAKIVEAYNKAQEVEEDVQTATIKLEDSDLAGKSETEQKPKELELSFNKALGQVTLSIKNFFWAKADNGQATPGQDPADDKYYSPVQRAYEAERQRLIEKLEGDEIDSYDKLVDLMADGSQTLTDCMGRALGIVDENGNPKEEFEKDANGKPIIPDDKLAAYRKQYITSLKEAQLYPEDSDRQNMNRAYNALRVSLKSGVALRDRRWVDKSAMEILVNTVIASNVDIPYTDAYGDSLTNQKLIERNREKLTDFYRYKQMQEANPSLYLDPNNHQAVEKAYQEYSEKNKERMTEFNEAVDGKVKQYLEDHKEELPQMLDQKAKSLVSGSKLNDDKGHTRYSNTDETKYNELYTPVIGSSLDAKDLSIVDLSKLDEKGGPRVSLLKDPFTGRSINPWFFEHFNGEIDSYQEMAEKYKLEGFKEKLIDLSAYYLSKDSNHAGAFANRAKYYVRTQAVTAVYKQDGTDHKCPPGLYLCKETNTSGTGGSDEELAKNQGGFTENEFELTYTPTTSRLGDETPKLDKSSNKGSVSTKPVNEEKDTIDFSIQLKVDHMSYEEAIQKVMEATTAGEERDKKLVEVNKQYNNGKNKHMVITSALMVDVLPEGLDFNQNSQVMLEVASDAFYKDKANQTQYPNLDDFLKKVEIVTTDDLEGYLAALKKDTSVDAQNRVKAIEKFMDQYREKSNKGDKAQFDAGHTFVLAFLPEFEATHTDKAQFTLKLTGLNAKEDAKVQADVPNRTVFVSDDESFVGYDVKTFDITDGSSGRFNKYLRLYDQDGNPVPLDSEKSTPEEWFKGTTKVKFGDKFDYKLTWRGRGADRMLETGKPDYYGHFDLTDNLPQFDEMHNKLGFRPQLRGDVQVLGDNANLLTIIYELEDGTKITVTPEQRQKADGQAILSPEQLALVKSVNLEYDAKDGNKKFDPTQGVDLIIPMQVPEFQTKIVDGKIALANGQYMDLAAFLQGSTIKADNEATAITDEPSNKVTTELTHDILQVMKRWYDRDGKESSAEDLKNKPVVSFKLKRVARTFGYDEKGNLVYQGAKELKPEDYKYKGKSTITVSYEDDYQKLIQDLQKTKSHKVFKGDGSLDLKQSTFVIYDYFVEEIPLEGYDAHKEEVNAELGLDKQAGSPRIFVNEEGQFVNKEGKLLTNAWGKYLYVDAQTGKLTMQDAPEDKSLKDDRFGLVQVAGNTTKPPTPPETPPGTPPGTPPEIIVPPPPVPSEPEEPGPAPIISKAFIQNLPKTASVQSSWPQTVDEPKEEEDKRKNQAEKPRAHKPARQDAQAPQRAS